MSEFSTVLDRAVEGLRRGEAPTVVLARYPDRATDLAPLLAAVQSLELLGPAQMPSEADLAADRNQFLAELSQMPEPAVSPGRLMRLRKWITQNSLLTPNPTYVHKEQRRMNALLIKATLVFTLLFGSAIGGAAAADKSLPGSPFYPLKIGLEEAQLALAADPVMQASLWQARVAERLAEMQQLARQGKGIDETALTRLQNQAQRCLQEIAGLPEPAMNRLLEQLQAMVQEKQQAMEQLGSEQAGLQAAVQAAAQIRQAATDGLSDPVTFRYRYGHQRPADAPDQPYFVPDQNGNGPAQRPQSSGPKTWPTHVPQSTGDANRHGPQPEQPGPGQPGGNPESTCTPAPTGDANRYGPKPEKPGPGQPGGNPDGQNTPQPTGDANRHGPQPEQPGPGQPGGNPESTCTPAPTGDANQYGPQPNNGSDGPGGPDRSGGSGNAQGTDQGSGQDSAGGSNCGSDSGGASSGSSNDTGSSSSGQDSGGSSNSGSSSATGNSSSGKDSGSGSNSGGSGDTGSSSSDGNSGGGSGSGKSGRS